MGERLAFTFALTGRREWGHGTQGVALALDLLGFQPAQGRRQGFFRNESMKILRKTTPYVLFPALWTILT